MAPYPIEGWQHRKFPDCACMRLSTALTQTSALKRTKQFHITQIDNPLDSGLLLTTKQLVEDAVVEMTTMRKWMGATLAWPLFWILVFDKWFFWTPIGLFIALGIPIAGWAVWWNFYRGAEDKIALDGRKALGKSVEVLHKLKKRIADQKLKDKAKKAS